MSPYPYIPRFTPRRDVKSPENARWGGRFGGK